jgi:hypothetical protein
MIKTAAGGMVNVALECTGFESSIRTAIFVSHATTPEFQSGMSRDESRIPEESRRFESQIPGARMGVEGRSSQVPAEH